MPTAAYPPGTAVPDARSGSLLAIAAGLLGLEALPLSVVLWGEANGWPSVSAAILPVPGALWAAIFITAITVAVGVLAVDDPGRVALPARRWLWQGFVGLLLLPTVVSAAFLAPPLSGGHPHGHLLILVLLGIADGQMAAAICLRQAGDAIPTNRFRAAELDCVTAWQRLRHVVLPACATALPMLAALTFVGTWSEFLLVATFRRNPTPFALSLGMAPENFVAAIYLFASVPMIFLGLWMLRVCVRGLTNPFARS